MIRDTGDPIVHDYLVAKRTALSCKGVNRDAALKEMRELARLDGDLALDMCRLAYCSSCIVPDPEEAAMWAMRAAS